MRSGVPNARQLEPGRRMAAFAGSTLPRRLRPPFIATEDR
jgi:hypothetical protein